MRFEERNSFGASNFTTTDAKVAEAIRRHTMTQRGVIRETTQPEEKKQKPAKAAPQSTTPPDAGEQAPDAGGETGGEQTPPEEAGNDGNVINADNFTLAKEAVMKRFGVEADAVKTPILLNQFCKERGITVHYKRK